MTAISTEKQDKCERYHILSNLRYDSSYALTCSSSNLAYSLSLVKTYHKIGLRVAMLQSFFPKTVWRRQKKDSLFLLTAKENDVEKWEEEWKWIISFDT